MRKFFSVFAVLLLAAACNKQQPASNSQNSTASIESISVEPSHKIDNWILYNDGAVVKVVAKNVQSVEIKFDPTGTGQTTQSLGQATSLSSQQYAWALPLPAGIMATNMWAEAKDSSGNIIKSPDLGNVGYEQQLGYQSPAKYGFSIEYPDSFGFSTDYDQVKALSYIPSCDENMVACAFLKKENYSGTNFDGAGVSVNIDSTLNTETKCYNFAVSTNEAQQQVADVNINGTNFKSATGGGGAAGHYDKLQVYRNFHNGMCYEIAQHVVATQIGNYPTGTVKEFNQDEVWQRLQGVVNTFQFANLNKTSAQPVSTQVISNSKYGYQMQIPSDWVSTGTNTSILSVNSPENQNLLSQIKAGKVYGEGYQNDITVTYYNSVQDEPENLYNKLGANTIAELIKKDQTMTDAHQIQFAGTNAYGVSWGGFGVYYTILAQYNGHLYEIQFGNKSEASALSPIENAILASFKFTK